MRAERLRGIPLAERTGAINLGQGFPDVDGPASMVAAAVDALQRGANQYPPGIGIPPLREAIARHQQRHYGLDLDPDTQVVVTTGCTANEAVERVVRAPHLARLPDMGTIVNF